MPRDSQSLTFPFEARGRFSCRYMPAMQAWHPRGGKDVQSCLATLSEEKTLASVCDIHQHIILACTIGK